MTDPVERLFSVLEAEQSPERGNEEGPKDLYATVSEKMEKGMAMQDPEGWEMLDQIIGKQFEGFQAGAANLLTFGLNDEIQATKSWVKDNVVSAFDGEREAKSYMEHLDATAEADQRLREDAPISYTGGQVVGGGITSLLGGGIAGAALQTGAKSSPFLKATEQFIRNNPLKTSTALAGAEGGAYALAEGEDPVWGTIQGAGFGAGFGMLYRGAQNWFKTKATKATKGDRDAFRELEQTFKEQGVELTPELRAEWEAKVSKLGPDAKVADVDEVLLDLVAATMLSSKNKGRSLKVAEGMRQRMKALPEQFNREVASLFKGEAMPFRKLARIHKEHAQLLQPEYRDIMAKHGTKAFPSSKVTNRVNQIFNSTDDAYGGQRKAVHKRVSKIMDDFVTTMEIPGGPSIKYMTPTQLRSFRDEIDGIMSLGKYTTKKGQDIAINSKTKRLLSKSRRAITEELHAQVPEIAGLDSQLAAQHTIANAYDEGLKFAGGGKGYSAADTLEFISEATPSELMYAAEGFKAQWMKKVSKATTPEAMLKVAGDPEMMRKAEAFLGEDLAKGLQESVEKYATLATTGNTIKSAAKEATKQRRNNKKGLFEKLRTGVAIGGVAPGVSSNIAALGAAKDIAQTTGMKLSKAGLSKLDEMLSKPGMEGIADIFEGFGKPDMPFVGTPGSGAVGSDFINLDKSDNEGSR